MQRYLFGAQRVPELADDFSEVLILAQCRQAQGRLGNAVVKIGAKFAARHGTGEVAVRGGDDRDVDRVYAAAAKRGDFALLQHAQQATLRALVSASRNGWFYAIDRTNGKLIYAEKFVTATSVNGIKDGRMTTDPELRPTIDKEVFTCPSFLGGKNWWPISVDPQTQMAYVPSIHTCMTIKGATVSYKAGLPFLGESFKVMADPAFKGIWGEVQAIDVNTGKQVWGHQTALPWNGGMLSTAGGLVFSGSADGYLHAFDAKTGKVLWKSPQMISGIIGVPSTWKVNGKQYVSVYAGWGGDMAKEPDVRKIPLGGHFYVFSL